MKKVAVLALVLAMGMVVNAGAASVGVPWFVDNSGAGQTLPPTNGNITTIVYLNNSSTSPIVCQIQYYSASGAALPMGTNNTFSIAGGATIAFRPVADDLGFQENATGAAVPNRPTTDGAKNGSIRIIYDDDGGNIKITGKAESWGFRSTTNGYAAMNSAYLLPN